MLLSFRFRSEKKKVVGGLPIRKIENRMEGFSTAKEFVNGKDLISTKELADTLGKSGLKILDATWGLTRKNCYENDYLKQRIPGSLFFDIDQISGALLPAAFSLLQTNPQIYPTCSLLPNNSKKKWKKWVRPWFCDQLGISNSDSLVIYDRSGAFVASARVITL